MAFFKSIKFKITIIVMTCFLLLLFPVIFYLYYEFRSLLKQQAVNNAMQITEQMNIGRDDSIREIRVISYTAYLDEEIMPLLIDENKDEDNYEVERKFSRYFTSISAYRNDIKGIAFSMKDGKTYHNNAYVLETINYDFDYNRWEQVFKKSRTFKT